MGTMLVSTSRAWTRTTCRMAATSWSTRRTPLSDRRKSSLLRFRCSTFPTRSRAATADRLRALRPFRMPHLQDHMEDGKGDRRQEIGGPSLAEVQRDGGVLLPASAASGVRQLQELRGPFARRLHGWQRRGDAWKGHCLRAEGGCRRQGRQEEVKALGPTHDADRSTEWSNFCVTLAVFF